MKHRENAVTSSNVVPLRAVAVRSSASSETADLLRDLLADAEAGRLCGLAFAAMYTGKKFVVETVGESKRSPTFTRGMLKALDDEIAAGMQTGQ